MAGRWALLIASSALSGFIWWAALTRVMWLPTFIAVPHMDTPRFLGVSEATMQSFALVAGAELLLYLLAFWACRPFRSGRSAAGVVLLALPIAIPLILSYPGGAGDVYAYIAEADSVLRYHVDPFRVPPSAIPGNPLLPFLDYPNETTHYGPLWIAIAVLLRLVAGPDLLTAVLLFKAMAITAHLAIGWMIYLYLRPTHASSAIPAALLVAWNPLLILELAQNAHNDSMMMLFVVIAFYLQSRGARRSAVIALLGASMVKYVAVILIPLFLVADLRTAGPWRRWLLPTTLQLAGISALGAAVINLVSIEGTLGILQKMSTWYTTSAAAVAYYYLASSMSPDEAGAIVGNAGKAVFALAYLPALFRVWRDPRRLLGSSLVAVIALLVAATNWFQPWYALWAIPLAAMMAGAPSTALLLGMTSGGFAVHLIMGFAWRLNWNQVTPVEIHAAGTAGMWIPVAILPLAAYLLCTLLERRGLIGSGTSVSTHRE